MQVEDYLHDVEEGTFQSSGTFTVDVTQARQKLADFQLRSRLERTLKVIQGLVLLGGRRLWLTEGKDSLSFLLENAAGRLNLAVLSSGLSTARLGSGDSPEEHMGTGILAELADGHPCVYWAVFGDHEEPVVEQLFGTPGEVRLNLPRAAHRPGSVCLHLNHLSSEPISPVQLYERCAFAPIPLLLNGSLVQAPTWQPASSYSRASYWHADCYVVDDSLGASALSLTPPGRCRTRLGEAPDWDKFCQEGESVGVRTYTSSRPLAQITPIRFETPSLSKPWLPMLANASWQSLPGSCQVLLGDEQDPSHIWVVKGGVLLDPVPLKLSVPGLTVVCTGPDVRTDLSQFKPIQDDRWDALEASLVEPILCLLKLACEETPKRLPGMSFGLATSLSLTAALSSPGWMDALFPLSGTELQQMLFVVIVCGGMMVCVLGGLALDRRLEGRRLLKLSRQGWSHYAQGLPPGHPPTP